LTRARAYLLAAPVAALLGYLAVHALVGGGERDRPSAATRAASRTVPSRPVSPALGPVGLVGAIPVGFAHSQRGAVAAAGNYLTVLSRALSPAARSSWPQAVRVLTVAPLRARALQGAAASASIARRLARSGSSFYLGSWLLGYRVAAYSPSRARVALWNFGVMSSAFGVVPPDYSTTTCVLRWAGGDWKLSDARVSAGPTPPSAATTRVRALEFAAAARRFTPYRDVP
jgi:hypothetical protein